MANEKAIEIPQVIGTRTAGLEELLKKWAKENPGVPWSVLIDRGLKKELAQFAGKRYAHLVSGFVDYRLLLFISAVVVGVIAVALCAINWRHSHEPFELFCLIGFPLALGLVCYLGRRWLASIFLAFLLLTNVRAQTAEVSPERSPDGPVLVEVVCGTIVIVGGVVIYIELNKLCHRIPPVTPPPPPPPTNNCVTCTNCPGPNCPTNSPPSRRFSLPALSGDNVAAASISPALNYAAPDGSQFSVWFHANVSGSWNPTETNILCTVDGWVSPTCVLTVTSSNGVELARNTSTRTAGESFEHVVPVNVWDASQTQGFFTVIP